MKVWLIKFNHENYEIKMLPATTGLIAIIDHMTMTSPFAIFLYVYLNGVFLGEIYISLLFIYLTLNF